MTLLSHARRAAIEATRKRRAVEVVGAFVRQFDSWHTRSAMIFGLLMAARSDRAAVLADLSRLAAEVRGGYEEFKLMIENEPRHGRIDDLDSTFRRLLHSLEAHAE